MMIERPQTYGSPLRGNRLAINSQTNLRDTLSPRENPYKADASAVRPPEPYKEEDLLNRTSSKKAVSSRNQSVNNS